MIKELGRQIASHLGEGFEVDEDANVNVNDRYVVIRNRLANYDEQFRIVICHIEQEKKLKVHGKNPTARDGSFSGNTESIGISDRKNAAQVAAEIKRRFLPEYTAAFNKGVIERDRCNAYLDQRDANLAMFAEMLGGKVRGSKVLANMGDYKKYGYISEFHVSEKTVDLELRSVPIEVVQRIIKAWKDE